MSITSAVHADSAHQYNWIKKVKLEFWFYDSIINLVASLFFHFYGVTSHIGESPDLNWL